MRYSLHHSLPQFWCNRAYATDEAGPLCQGHGVHERSGHLWLKDCAGVGEELRGIGQLEYLSKTAIFSENYGKTEEPVPSIVFVETESLQSIRWLWLLSSGSQWHARDLLLIMTLRKPFPRLRVPIRRDEAIFRLLNFSEFGWERTRSILHVECFGLNYHPGPHYFHVL